MFGKKHNKKKIDFLSAHEKFDDLIASLFHRRRKRNWPAIIVKFLFKFLVVIFVLLVIAGGFFIWHYRGLYDLAVSGKKSLEGAIVSAQRQDFGQMLSDSQEAIDYFSEFLAEVKAMRSNFLLKRFALADQ